MKVDWKSGTLWATVFGFIGAAVAGLFTDPQAVQVETHVTTISVVGACVSAAAAAFLAAFRRSRGNSDGSGG